MGADRIGEDGMWDIYRAVVARGWWWPVGGWEVLWTWEAIREKGGEGDGRGDGRGDGWSIFFSLFTFLLLFVLL